MAIRAKRVPVVKPLMSCWRKISIGRELIFAQHGHELELACLDSVAAHRAKARVAVLVERPLTEGAVEAGDRQRRGADGVPVLLPRAPDGLDSDLAALVAVHGVSLGVLAELLL